MLVFALAGALCACGGTDPSSPIVPGFLIGTWRTESESHRDAFLRLTATTLEIGTVEGTLERYSVSIVRLTQDDLGELHVIEFEDALGDGGRFELYFDNGTIRLKNQHGMVWRKSSN